jgi:hypothetical protein
VALGPSSTGVAGRYASNRWSLAKERLHFPIHRMVGGAALFRSGPREQIYRDIRAAIIYPFAGYDTLGLLGKLAFGIPYNIMPR